MEAAVTLNQADKVVYVIRWAMYYRVFVETGLWAGAGVSTTLRESHPEMVCYAIDLNEDNVVAAAAKGVRAFWGDSADVLPLLLRNLDEPACFWLDAHYSPEVEGDAFNRAHPCPLLAELEAILAWPHAALSTVLIDDVRLLGAPGWPSRKAVFDVLANCPWAILESADILRLAAIQ